MSALGGLLVLTLHASPVTLLAPGPQSAKNVKGVSPTGWLALWPDGLAKATVTFERVSDPLLDDGKPETVKTGIDVRVDGGPARPIVLIKGLPPRKVSSVLKGAVQLCEPQKIGAVVGDSVVLACETTESKGVRLVAAVNGEHQTLYSQTGLDTDGWVLEWAGDLDGDGRLDLLLSADEHSALRTRRLFLSSGAGKRLYREAAVLKTPGC